MAWIHGNHLVKNQLTICIWPKSVSSPPKKNRRVSEFQKCGIHYFQFWTYWKFTAQILGETPGCWRSSSLQWAHVDYEPQIGARGVCESLRWNRQLKKNLTKVTTTHANTRSQSIYCIYIYNIYVCTCIFNRLQRTNYWERDVPGCCFLASESPFLCVEAPSTAQLHIELTFKNKAMPIFEWIYHAKNVRWKQDPRSFSWRTVRLRPLKFGMGKLHDYSLEKL